MNYIIFCLGSGFYEYRAGFATKKKHLRREIIKENKKLRKQENKISTEKASRKQEKKERKHALDQESVQEKKKNFLIFLVTFSVEFLFSCFFVFLLSCFLTFLFTYRFEGLRVAAVISDINNDLFNATVPLLI